MTNMTVVGAFLSRHKRLTQFQHTNVAKQGGGAVGQGAYLVCTHPQQRLARLASWVTIAIALAIAIAITVTVAVTAALAVGIAIAIAILTTTNNFTLTINSNYNSVVL